MFLYFFCPIVNLDVDNVIFIGKDENDKIYIENGNIVLKNKYIE